MMNKVLYFGIMAGAAAIAAVATWVYAKDKFAKQASDDISEMKAYYKEKYESQPKEEAPEPKKKEQPKTEAQKKAEDLKTYRQMARDKYKANHEEEEGNPHVITPEEFGENNHYDRITLTYYADHVLADENDEVIRDVEETIGFGSLNHFGEYEADIVYVQNDILKCYYEITRDLRKYEDVAGELPYRPEVN
jgi:hypothetical protein